VPPLSFAPDLLFLTRPKQVITSKVDHFSMVNRWMYDFAASSAIMDTTVMAALSAAASFEPCGEF